MRASFYAHVADILASGAASTVDIRIDGYEYALNSLPKSCDLRLNAYNLRFDLHELQLDVSDLRLDERYDQGSRGKNGDDCFSDCRPKVESGRGYQTTASVDFGAYKLTDFRCGHARFAWLRLVYWQRAGHDSLVAARLNKVDVFSAVRRLELTGLTYCWLSFPLRCGAWITLGRISLENNSLGDPQRKHSG